MSRGTNRGSMRPRLLRKELDWLYAECMLAQMAVFVIGDPVLPESPSDLEPAIGEASISMAERITVRADRLKIRIGPDGVVDGALGPLLHNRAELMVTGVAEKHILMFAARPGDRAGSSKGLEHLWGGKALTIVAELGQKGWSQDLSSTGQRGKDQVIRMLDEESLDLADGCGSVLHGLQ
jgi:hypothetical protein